MLNYVSQCKLRSFEQFKPLLGCCYIDWLTNIYLALFNAQPNTIQM